MEKEVHRRTGDELKRLKEHVAELQAKQTSYEIGKEYKGEGVEVKGMFDEKGGMHGLSNERGQW